MTRTGAAPAWTSNPRLLQAGDLVRTREGWTGEVTGVDLDDTNETSGPTFIITTDDGHKVRRKSSAVTITKDSPASNPEAYR